MFFIFKTKELIDMGQYYECNVCGAREKGFRPCDCSSKQNDIMIELRIGATILGIYVAPNFAIIEKIQKDDVVYYLALDICSDSIYCGDWAEITGDIYDKFFEDDISPEQQDKVYVMIIKM